MKLNKFFFGLFVCASFCACSNDESELITGDVPKVFTGDEAYINVRLSDASSLTRATDGGYEYGTADEHTVNTAHFYFYDADGLFVSEGSAWNGGTDKDKNDANIEFKGDNVVVLKGLTDKKYPKYMVTVLNRPNGFSVSPTSTLNEMQAKLSDENSVGIVSNDCFVMSTTSFKHDDDFSGKYFVNEVNESNFSLEPIDHDKNSDNYVTVYVERLAAKVTLKVDESANGLTSVTLKDKEGYEISDRTFYKIKATVAGDNNAETDDDAMAVEDLYVELLGWKLNATAKKSYIVKNINDAEEDNGWSDTSLGFTWNKPTDFRSFWGMSFNYGNTNYTYPTTGVGYDENDATIPLHYFNLNSVLEVDASAYCAENTNTSAILNSNYPSAVTSVLLKARVCNVNGEPLDLVRFNGVLFEKSHFLEYILNGMELDGDWNIYVAKQVGNDTEYTQLGTDDVKLSNVGDGKVKIELNISENEELYSRSGTEGNYTYSEIKEDNFIGNVNAKLATKSADAIGFNSGLMYYNIPIEHLNPAEVTRDDAGVVTNVPEATYGVVRNHHYVITVNELENMGKGIFDPDEVIVPNTDDEGNKYYVGANINILSWKIVSQTVGL